MCDNEAHTRTSKKRHIQRNKHSKNIELLRHEICCKVQFQSLEIYPPEGRENKKIKTINENWPKSSIKAIRAE